MTRMSTKILPAVLIASCLGAVPASAGVRITVVLPPPEFIATETPVYYEGRPVYLYRGQWFYREGREWRHYRGEPSHLREYREGHRMEPHYYGHRHRR